MSKNITLQKSLLLDSALRSNNTLSLSNGLRDKYLLSSLMSM